MRIIVLLIDVIFIFVISPWLIIYITFLIILHNIKKKGKVIGSGSILHISNASSTENIIKKFGSLDFLFEYDGGASKDVFNKDIYCWFPTSNNLKNVFKNRWIFIEQKKILNIFSISSWIIFLFRVLNIAIQEGVTVIRGWEPSLSGLSAWIIHRFFNIPYCISLHADYETRYRISGLEQVPHVFGSRKIAEIIEAWTIRHADCVLPIRESIIPYAVKKGAKQIQVIPHGIDLAPFTKPIDESKINTLTKGQKVITSISRLSKDNYIYDVLSIAEEVVEKNSDVLFYIIGDGVEYEILKTRIEKNHLQYRIYLTGFIDREEVILHRRISSVNVALMGGFSLLEAMASGNPTIAYDVEWHYEVIKNNETGYLIPEGNISEAVRYILELLNDRVKAQKIGEAGKKLIFEKHDIKKTSQILCKVYVDLLDKSIKQT